MKIRDLPLGTQLNIAADKLATTGLQKLTQKPMVLIAPTSEVMFHFRNKTITVGFKQTMRQNILLLDFMTYYMERFGWTVEIFNRIDWDNFGPAFRKLADTNLQWYQKYYSKKLPTGCRLNKKQLKFEAR